MPNRMLRDWTQSDKVDELTADSERFFIRLIMKADDYGCFYGDTRLLKANLFPLKLDKVREADISRWIAECVKAGLILFYEIESKKYIQIKDFRQRLDKAKARFPLPITNGFPEVVNEFPAELEVELEVEQKKKSMEDVPSGTAKNLSEDEKRFKKFQEWIETNASRVAKMKEPFTFDQFLKLKTIYSIHHIQDLLTQMHNWNDLLKKRVSAYLTFIRWSEKNEQSKNEQPKPTGTETTREKKARQKLIELGAFESTS